MISGYLTQRNNDKQTFRYYLPTKQPLSRHQVIVPVTSSLKALGVSIQELDPATPEDSLGPPCEPPLPLPAPPGGPARVAVVSLSFPPRR